MSKDFTNDLVNDTLKELYSDWKAKGLSDDEILLRITDNKIEHVISEVTKAIVDDSIKWLKDNMLERVMDERSRTADFTLQNEKIWGEGFLASEAMYQIAIESGQGFSDIVMEKSEEERENYKYTFVVLNQIYGRACQQFLEILHLIKGGFADGAFARWRSLYELSVVSEFIRQKGEEVAKSYYYEGFSDNHYKNSWAKAAPCFASRKGNNIPLEDLKEKCGFINSAWTDCYRLANKIVHSPPQGTFGRIGSPDTFDIATPVGHSSYGLAAPAINSAISLAIISANYFVSAPSGDGIAYIGVISKWANIVRDCYERIEKISFSIYNGDEAGK